jgi:hypothetical protein
MLAIDKHLDGMLDPSIFIAPVLVKIRMIIPYIFEQLRDIGFLLFGAFHQDLLGSI